jgi:hypothetical protein
MPIPPLSVEEDKLRKAANLSRARAGQIQKYDRLRMSGKARFRSFQIRGPRRLLSSKSTIFGSLGRWQE